MALDGWILDLVTCTLQQTWMPGRGTSDVPEAKTEIEDCVGCDVLEHYSPLVVEILLGVT